MRLPTCRRLALPALLLVLPAALPAETRIVPCRLPAESHMLFTFEEQGWAPDGSSRRTRLARTIHLARDGAGYSLTIDPARASGESGPARLRRLAKAYDPADQRVMTVRLDAMGRVLGIDALADHWRARVARVERLVTTVRADGGSTQRAQAILDRLRTVDAATQLGYLAGEAAGPLLRMCGQPAAVEALSDGLLAIAEDKDGEALHETAHYRVDAATGLTRSIERRVVVKAQPDRAQLSSWRFEPVQ